MVHHQSAPKFDTYLATIGRYRLLYRAATARSRPAKRQVAKHLGGLDASSLHKILQYAVVLRYVRSKRGFRLLRHAFECSLSWCM